MSVISNSSAAFSARSLLISEGASRRRRWAARAGQCFLFMFAAVSAVALLFILYFIVRDALPFFRLQGFWEFFVSKRWYPSAQSPEFGARAIFFGSALVTAGAIAVAAPLGVLAAVCLSDILPFAVRQMVKPVIEILAVIPSVAYGFFALVIFAPLLQNHGGAILTAGLWLIGAPLALIAAASLSELLAGSKGARKNIALRLTLFMAFAAVFAGALVYASHRLSGLRIASGANALNVSIILGVMALPTIVSISEDALSSVGRELREASYALGATRAETILKVAIPAAKSGILAAVILGVMRALGETMVVWMASGNAAQIPSPWFDYMQPVRTLTATIAGDMGEADQITGSARYHVLFAMGLCLLIFSFIGNLISEWALLGKKPKRTIQCR
ncbi:MAG: PstC family ABC transporter permease [Candidatus Sumerlaeota bacterium]|nr:PstC family ABC transporter permease [Candidatus Sumerlaeota bacterium]